MDKKEFTRDVLGGAKGVKGHLQKKSDKDKVLLIRYETVLKSR